ASESVLPGTAPAEALHTFTLDSGAACCFFRDNTNLTPLPAAVPVRLADPSEGPVLARSSTVLPCPAVPSGSLSGLHLPSFSTNLVSTAALQDAMVTTTTPGGQRVSICTCTRTGRHLATFTRRPGSSLYTLATEPPQTLLWHHRLGHPFLPRLRGMHSHLLVSGLPRSHPPLPPSPAPPCLPCVEGRQCAAPHSSSFPQMTAPLQTLHMDVWGPARAGGASGAGVSAGAGGPGGVGPTSPGSNRTGGTGAAGAGGAGGAGVKAGGTAGAGGAGIGATGAAPLPAPAPYTEQTGRLRERRDRESCPASLFRTGRRVPRLHPPPIPDTHAMALRPSSVPLRVPLRAPPESSLPAVHDPESDCARAASPTVSRLLATVVSDPSFESTAASALVAILVEFAALCRLDYATALLVETESYCPLSVGGECALGTDALEDRREDFDCLAANVPHFASMLLALEGDPDAPDIPTPCSYADAITGPYSSQWQAAMDAEMASWKSTGTYTDAVPPSRANIVAGTSLPSFYDLVYVLQRFGFQFSSPQPTPLSTSHSLSAPPSDKSVEPSGPYPELVGFLMYLITCIRPDLAYPLSLLARCVAPDRHRKGYTFSLSSGSVSWRSTRSSSVLSSSCEAEIYAGAMAAQELR
ncbi:unnamed protein product, partial [Closterium sp. NIES-53]